MIINGVNSIFLIGVMIPMTIIFTRSPASGETAIILRSVGLPGRYSQMKLLLCYVITSWVLTLIVLIR